MMKQLPSILFQLKIQIRLANIANLANTFICSMYNQYLNLSNDQMSIICRIRNMKYVHL